MARCGECALNAAVPLATASLLVTLLARSVPNDQLIGYGVAALLLLLDYHQKQPPVWRSTDYK
jgi:hypothetical protein